MTHCIRPDCKFVIKSENLKGNIVKCKCETEFCFSCKDEAHFPCPCDLAITWKERTTKDDSNIQWIKVNTKICPFCKNGVERNLGCNFIHCSPPGGCGRNFCYICSQAWEPLHNNHYKCNVYRETDQQVKQAEKSKQELKIYNFYYDNYINCVGSIRKANQILKENTENFEKIIQFQLNFAKNEYLFFIESIQKLIEFKIVAKWTFAYGYYIQRFSTMSSQLYDNFSIEYNNSTENLAVRIQK